MESNRNRKYDLLCTMLSLRAWSFMFIGDDRNLGSPSTLWLPITVERILRMGKKSYRRVSAEKESSRDFFSIAQKMPNIRLDLISCLFMFGWRLHIGSRLFSLTLKFRRGKFSFLRIEKKLTLRQQEIESVGDFLSGIPQQPRARPKKANLTQHDD